MSEDIVQRLRALPPEMAGPGDRFDRVRVRAVRRRRRLAVAAVAAVTVVAAIGVPLGLALAGGGSDRPHRPAVPTLSCPRTFGPQPWVPQRPTGVDGRSRLVPQQPPQQALVCTSGGRTTFPTRKGSGGRIPPGGRVLSGGLDRLAGDLTWLPGKLPRVADCRVLGRSTYYLLGLTYPDGVVWVATAEDSCTGTFNGEFTSQRRIGMQVAASYAVGAWVPDPLPRPTGPGACPDEQSGRLGQETAMVPPDPVSVQICKFNRGARDSFDTRTSTGGYRDLVDALNALPTRPSTGVCDGGPPELDSYQLIFRYATGPSVRVGVQPRCSPPIVNGSLQAGDAGSVLPKITRIFGAGS
jgi:hypothetical protein